MRRKAYSLESSLALALEKEGLLEAGVQASLALKAA